MIGSAQMQNSQTNSPYFTESQEEKQGKRLLAPQKYNSALRARRCRQKDNFSEFLWEHSKRPLLTSYPNAEKVFP